MSAAMNRLVRAASNVAGAETREPEYDALLIELQEAVTPFECLISLPPVGSVVQYYNPSYSAVDNEHTGVGPYAAIVTRAWEYYDSILCNLAVVTPGKDSVCHVGSVPERESIADNGAYPCWTRKLSSGNGQGFSDLLEVADRIERSGFGISREFRRDLKAALNRARGHCPGHVASDGDPKVCRHCGTHVDEYRDEPPEAEA